MRVEGYTLYSSEGRQAYLDRLAHPEIARQLRGHYEVLDVTLETQKQAKSQMLRLGQRYPEIQEFQKMPGVGPIGSHLFDAFIQTPYRFKTKQKLWRYCQLGIRSKTTQRFLRIREAARLRAARPHGA